MGEAVISMLIEQLGAMAIGGIGEEVRLVRGVKKDVQNLKSSLEDIQAVLEDSEKKQLSDAAVKRWLQKLKNASDDVDNVLDDWYTAILEHKIKKDEEEENITNALEKKVCYFPMHYFSCFSSTKVDRLIMSRETALRIKQLNVDLARISEDRLRYNFSTSIAVERPKLSQTTFLIDETKVHGRDEEKSLLVSKLLSESESLDIIPIVGLGGLGKTTLAQLAYNEEEVKTHFAKRIWVCVSDPFDEIKVSKAIVDGLGSGTESSELNAVVKCIHESIEGKRVLIVLDDVWLEDHNKWEILGEALRNGGRGSRVLVTTRKQEVAIMMGATANQISLRTLSEEHCWSIFRQLAFMGRTPEECAQLEPIGRKIAAKSRGLPLVAKTLGSLVRFKKTPSQWDEILGSPLWESGDAKVRDVFAPFLLSYYDLPPRERRCFLYCLVFPKDFYMQRDDLIMMWMSQGYLGKKVDSWKRGRDCFESLAMRSFFQDFKDDAYDGVIRCKMHDIVHDFAHFLTGDEFFFMEVDTGGETMMVEENTRHLTLLVISPGACSPDSLRNAMNLRTLALLFKVIGERDEMLLFSQLTCLRTLNLQCSGFERLSEDIGLLKHLRYLDLSKSDKLIELPQKLFSLYNLETLKLCECVNLKTLPESISRLVNLKHLYLYSCPLEGLPKGIGKLSHLRTLDTIIVPKEKESHLNLGELSKLKHLDFQGYLGITQCGNAGSMIDDVTKMDLNGKPHLLVLALYFRDGSDHEDTNDDNDTAFLNSIHPHPNLKALAIHCYEGHTMSPVWMMSMANLTHLKLNRFPYCETFPDFGKLPSLVYLEMMEISHMYTLGEESLGVTEADQDVILFPRLEELAFSRNYWWRRWEGSNTKERSIIMPRLRTLTIHWCTRLETLPEFLQGTPLQELSIVKSEPLEYHCKKDGKEWHKISHVPNIFINRRQVQKDGDWIHIDEESDVDDWW